MVININTFNLNNSRNRIDSNFIFLSFLTNRTTETIKTIIPNPMKKIQQESPLSYLETNNILQMKKPLFQKRTHKFPNKNSIHFPYLFLFAFFLLFLYPSFFPFLNIYYKINGWCRKSNAPKSFIKHSPSI